MIQVLFVCLGNICRSPMAEAVFRHKVKEAGLSDRILVDSAGTGNWHVGKPPHEGTRKILKRKGVSDAGIRGRQAREKDFLQFQYIIAMDSSNMSNLFRLAPMDHSSEVRKMLEFVPSQHGGDVPDPYYTGDFDEVYELVDEGCTRLLTYIREKEGL